MNLNYSPSSSFGIVSIDRLNVESMKHGTQRDSIELMAIANNAHSNELQALVTSHLSHL